jgi:hypothetical protein
VQTIEDISDSNHVTFAHVSPKVLEGPIIQGSRVVVDVTVTDIDVSYNNIIANFKFQYAVPDSPTGSTLLTARDTWNNWYSDMTISFQALFD